MNIELKDDDDEELYDSEINYNDNDNEKDDNIKLNIKEKKEKEEEKEEKEEKEEEEEEEEEDDDEDNAYITEDEDEDNKKPKTTTTKSNSNPYGLDEDAAAVANSDNEEEADTDDDEEEDDENYLKKFDKDLKNNYLESYHPEAYSHNFEEVKMLTNVVRDENNNVVDPLHKTIPFLTKFEKSRILGQRAKQIDSGATPFVKVDKSIIDGYVIALKELEEKKIPFIIKRPLPNGAFEYWNVSDLELVC
jgi:DNA-directed RNA polymerase I, II, and III subunit RPABC2